MTTTEFLARISERLGLPDAVEAERVVRSVLAVVGQRLSRVEGGALAEDLPAPVGAWIERDQPGQEFGREELYARIASRAEVREGIAAEYAVVVCRTVAEAAGGDAVERLRQELPPELAALFELPEPVEPVHFRHLHPERRTLAEGHGGGERPLYLARPERAHRHSVARSDNPHGDTKLSSARGLTQEREGETLAEGRPGHDPASHPTD